MGENRWATSSASWSTIRSSTASLSQGTTRRTRLRAACSGFDEAQDAGKVALIGRLIDGDFDAQEQPDGALFVYLFQDLCLALAQNKATEEIYVDDDRFPEFVTSSGVPARRGSDCRSRRTAVPPFVIGTAPPSDASSPPLRCSIMLPSRGALAGAPQKRSAVSLQCSKRANG